MGGNVTAFSEIANPRFSEIRSMLRNSRRLMRSEAATLTLIGFLRFK